MKFLSNRHAVYACQYHLVFVTKYRHKEINENRWQILKSKFEKVMGCFGGRIISANWEKDHVHLLIELPPKHSVSAVVNSLKGVSSRAVKAGTFWSPSYFAATTGGACLGKVKRYVESQRNSSPS